MQGLLAVRGCHAALAARTADGAAVAAEACPCCAAGRPNQRASMLSEHRCCVPWWAHRCRHRAAETGGDQGRGQGQSAAQQSGGSFTAGLRSWAQQSPTPCPLKCCQLHGCCGSRKPAALELTTGWSFSPSLVGSSFSTACLASFMMAATLPGAARKPSLMPCSIFLIASMVGLLRRGRGREKGEEGEERGGPHAPRARGWYQTCGGGGGGGTSSLALHFGGRRELCCRSEAVCGQREATTGYGRRAGKRSEPYTHCESRVGGEAAKNGPERRANMLSGAEIAILGKVHVAVAAPLTQRSRPRCSAQQRMRQATQPCALRSSSS